MVLEDVATKTNAKLIHLIAHSMGNRALINALHQIATAKRSNPRPHFNQVVLTAPDVDAQTFSSLASALVDGADRVTLYASSNDGALKLSKQYQGYRRAGDTDGSVTIVRGIDTIDVSAVDTNLVGHFYYGENRSVLTDVFNLFQGGKSPDQRFGLRAMIIAAGRYWVFRP